MKVLHYYCTYYTKREILKSPWRRIQSRYAPNPRKNSRSEPYLRTWCSLTMPRNSKHHQRRFNFLPREPAAIWKNLRAQRARNKRERWGRTRRKERYRGRVLVTKEHVAAADAVARRGGGWSGGEFHNALVPGNPGRRMIVLYRLSASRASIGRGVSCLRDSVGYLRKSRSSKHHTSTIRCRRWISRRIMLQVNWKLISPRRERALERLMSLTSVPAVSTIWRREYDSFDDGQYLPS